jgi:hypothetical protein
MSHVSENDLVLLYYGELPDHGEAVSHLEQCAQCQAEYERLKRVLTTVGSVPVPEWSVDRTDALWAELRPRLESRTITSRGTLIPARRWAVAAAIAAGLLAAFALGRFWPRPQFETASAPGGVRERILLVAVGDHLERSQMMLVELVNSQGNGTVDIASEQVRAQDLVADNRLYRQTAARDGDAAVADVLDQLERLLLEIAHGPSQMPSQKFEALRRNIEAQGIIMKVRLVGAKARQSERPPARGSLQPSI